MDPSPAIPPIPHRHARDPDRARERDHDRQHRLPASSSLSSSSRRHNPSIAVSTAKANQHKDRPSSSGIPPASPEVISSLITSLAVISKPASHHFDGPSYLDPTLGGHRSPPTAGVSLPGSPGTARSEGSFGVDYGAFSHPGLGDLQEEDIPLDELAASPPVIKTAKPPSGFSPLTAPKSPPPPPRNASSGAAGGRRDSSSRRSLISGRGSSGALNASRPSSGGSLTSAPESIGNLSVEPGPALPLVEPQRLKKQRSHDSWGKKTGRGNRGLMYMSSRERIREKELDKKRASVGAVGGSSKGLGIATEDITGKPDPLAESVINEEPRAESPPHLDPPAAATAGAASPHGTTAEAGGNGAASPRPIPARDSSLRKTGGGPGAKRSSARASRSSKRESESGTNDVIHEAAEEPSHAGRASGGGGGGGETSRRRARKDAEIESARQLALDTLQQPRPAASLKPHSGSYSAGHSPAGPSSPMSPTLSFDPLEEGAPFPAVAQGRRRDRESSADARHRRRSGRQTPDIFGGYVSEGGSVGVKLKRSSSRLKRLSGAASPTTTADRYSSDHHGGGNHNNNTQSDQPHIAYERPRSADSIDDAVESYLCSPRLSQKIRHPQTGRVISFSEVGDPNGSAVFCCVGMGLTRYITAFYDELALTLKLRLITPDRPGVGDSEPYAEGTATPLGWPDDVYAICQALKITKFSILAHSAGAIYALATALRMPQHIRGRIHLLAPWIPPSQMSVFGASAQTPLPPTNAIPTSQRILRALPTPLLKAANSSFMTATSSSITSSLPKQKRTRRDKRTAAAANKDGANKSANGGGGGGGGLDNKENQHVHGGTKDLPQIPPAQHGVVDASEDMDRIRPREESSAPEESAAGGEDGSSGHRHHRSNSSARRATAAKQRRQQHQQQQHKKQDDEEQILSAAAHLANSHLADRERQQIYDSRLTQAIWQLATTGANPAVDLLVCLERRHTIGFRYVDITRPVVIHHGSRDTRVPVENVKWLGKTMRRCEVRVLEGEGHGLMASAQVMGGVLMEISREWEEWGRVTGSTKRESERARRGTIGQAR